MTRTAAALAVLLVECIGAGASAATFAQMPPPERCQTAIIGAERTQDIPRHLLAAIGLVESGRINPLTGRRAPWPWTVDVGGHGTFFQTEAEAIEAVGALQAQGVRSIDVGCVQINLLHHQDAFANLQDAFDPQLNSIYGARFLKSLFRQTRSWGRAVALYHSATPALGTDYWRRVMAVWSGSASAPASPDPTQAIAQAWAATLRPAGPDPSDAFSTSITAAQPVRTLAVIPAQTGTHAVRTQFGVVRLNDRLRGYDE